MRFDRAFVNVKQSECSCARFEVDAAKGGSGLQCVWPVPRIRCIVGSGRPGSAMTRSTLQDVIRAVRTEIQAEDNRKVAEIVMYLMDTGRVKVDSAVDE